MFRANRVRTSGKVKQIVILVIALVSLAVPAGLGAPGAQAQPAQFQLNSVVATTTGLNLREQPTVNSSTIVAMPVNARAIIVGGPFNSIWYWLDYNGTRGYASGYYLVLVDDRYTPLPVPTETPGAGATATPPMPSPGATGSPTQGASPTPETSSTPNATVSPTPGNYTDLWLGEMSQGGNVRNGPGLTNKIIKGWWAGRRALLYQAITDDKGGVWYRVSEPPEAPMYVHSSLIRKVTPVQFEPARYRGRWINVNITQQIVTAYQDGRPVKVTLTSTGKKKTPTEIGVWKIYYRLPKQTMEGGNLASGDYYRLEDVPYPQYFHTSGEGMHGTFWHDNFGRTMSHGCVNLSTPMAEWLYNWTGVGTVVYVHY